MFCEKCGNRLEDTDIFCSRCGAKLGIIAGENTSQNSTASASSPNSKKAFLLVAGIFMILYGAIGLIWCTKTTIDFIKDTGFNPLDFLNKMGTLEWERDLVSNVIRFISLVISVILFAYSIAAGCRGTTQHDLQKCDFTANALLGMAAVNLILLFVWKFYNGDFRFHPSVFFLPYAIINYVPLIIFPLLYKFAAVKALKKY